MNLGNLVLDSFKNKYKINIPEKLSMINFGILPLGANMKSNATVQLIAKYVCEK